MNSQKKKWWVSAGVVFFLGSLIGGAVLFLKDKDAGARLRAVMKFGSPPRPGILAKIGDQEFSEDALMANQRFDFLSLERKRYDLLIANINQKAVEILIGEEAQKANLPLETYLEQKVTILPENAVTAPEIDAFMKERNIPDNADVRSRVEAFLKNQKKKEKLDAHLARLTQKNPIQIYFKKPTVNLALSLEKAPWDGKKDAPVQIVIISDFQCPFCAQLADTLKQVKQAYRGKVAFVFKHFPLSFHPDARTVAEASFCALEQSQEAFWGFHDSVFKNQKEIFAEGKLKLEALEKAIRNHVRLEAYRSCVAEKKYAAAVDADMKEVQVLGVSGTPLSLVNGSPISGAGSFQMFAEEIEDALRERE